MERAKEILVQAKSCETSQQLREALRLYEAAQLLLPDHPKLKVKIETLRGRMDLPPFSKFEPTFSCSFLPSFLPSFLTFWFPMLCSPFKMMLMSFLLIMVVLISPICPFYGTCGLLVLHLYLM